MAKTWLITGSGNGLGRDIAEAALAAGDNVVAGARRTEELAPLVVQYGDQVKPVTLEVRDEAAAKSAVRLAVESFGRLDVLVNNAGYGQIAPFEQMSAEDFQAVVDYLLLRRCVHHPRRHPGDAPAEQRLHLSGVFRRGTPGSRRQYAVPRGEVGRRRLQRRSRDGSRAFRRQEMQSGAGRHQNQLGTARKARGTGAAAGVRSIGRREPEGPANP
jgi:NAD(P)-dependent dehydrogenase (short-subunit alcohol dehydrogenase family)